MILRYLCALILLAAIFSMETAAQNTGTVRGVVDGPDGTAVPDASVALTKAVGGQPLTTTTDEEGGFALKNVPVGEYMLSVNAPGFKDAQIAVTVGPAALRPLRVKLKISSVDEKVTVSVGDQPVLLAEENHNDVQFNEHMTMNVPAKNGDPLAVPSLFLAPSVFGNGSSSPQIIVDGVESSALDAMTSTTFFGLANVAEPGRQLQLSLRFLF